MYWIGLQNSFDTCYLGCSLKKLNKKLHSSLLQALMETLQAESVTDSLVDVKPYIWETFNLGARLNVVQSETLEK